MRELTPPLLNEFGLRAAIDELVDKLPREAQITLEIDECIDSLVGSNAIHYYRIIQESLTNTLKHAQASQISVELSQVEDNIESNIRLLVKDNGVGFNPDEVTWGGLFGIQERINSLGGTLEIISDSGSQITALFPIKTNAE
jgi:NarL family two-component system sensor histidine kinase LiaS